MTTNHNKAIDEAVTAALVEAGLIQPILPDNTELRAEFEATIRAMTVEEIAEHIRRHEFYHEAEARLAADRAARAASPHQFDIVETLSVYHHIDHDYPLTSIHQTISQIEYLTSIGFGGRAAVIERNLFLNAMGVIAAIDLPYDVMHTIAAAVSSASCIAIRDADCDDDYAC